ncbi:hypothetical protein ONS95_000639 [Cadophora gregata]|uniref:uncharacterized protein n=1 Tax=Cadophora gregata TaxID=51156 RepID=UPI0026DD97AC|nr:uncharacterized protein ONS95_000639 [Cadophora gregata]KAK0125338.1 hypothetical protein ONS96_009187 [Cadophora gregata f. sp. sojae]KAK0128682.1 hypothetical protein ONS95_000639 [Cadophora gregata]
MESLGDSLGGGALQELYNVAKTLQQLQTSRLQQDLKYSTQIAAERQMILDQYRTQCSEMRVDHAIRRGEKTVQLWQKCSPPSLRTKSEAREKREKALAELKEVEDKEKVDLDVEHVRLTRAAEYRMHEHISALEKRRETEDKKTADLIFKLSGGVHYPKNLLGQVLVVDKLITSQNSLAKASSSMYPDLALTEDDFRHGIGFDAPTLDLYGIDPGEGVTKFGLVTPENSPPSPHRPRFRALGPPETPTNPPRKRIQSVAFGSHVALPATTGLGPILTPNDSAEKLPPTFEFRTGGVPHTPTKKAQENVFIDLTLDSDNEFPAHESHKVNRVLTNADSNQDCLTAIDVAVKTPKSKRKLKAKKPIVGAAVRGPNVPTIAKDEIRISPKSLAAVVGEVRKKSCEIAKPASVRECTPGLFDSDSDYSETESRKRRRATSVTAPQSSHRNRAGALTMSELIEHPSSELPFAKGTTFKVWARRLYLPRKLMKFSVNFIRAIKDNGEILKFNDETSPVGFYFLRKAHTFVPVIGHNHKEDVFPEWVLEEDEISHAQYNHEHALVCFTKTVGLNRDILVKFSTREDMWNFLAVASMEMEVIIYQNINLKLPRTWIA